MKCEEVRGQVKQSIESLNPIFNIIYISKSVRHNTYQPQYVLLKQFDYEKC